MFIAIILFSTAICAERKVDSMSKAPKGSIARRVGTKSKQKKIKKSWKQTSKEIISYFNLESNMRALGDTGHLGGEVW